MQLELVTPPEDAEILKLVSVAKLKENLRISHNREDELIADCIRDAYGWFDGRNGWLNRCVLTQTWRVYLPGFQNVSLVNGERLWLPGDVLALPLPLTPLQSVASVIYYAGGVQVAVGESAYRALPFGLMGAVRTADKWPVGLDIREDAVAIDVLCGWGDAEPVKQRAGGIRRAIVLLASDMFRNREDTYAEPRLVAVDRKIKNGIEKFAGRYRIVNDHA